MLICASLNLFLPGELRGQRSLAGYSPWGYKELETTEKPTLNLKLRHNKHVFMQLEFVLDLLVAASHCWLIPGLCMFH